MYRNDVYFLVECIESGGLKRATLIAIPPYYEDEHVTSEGNGRDVIAVYAYRFKYQSIFDRGY